MRRIMLLGCLACMLVGCGGQYNLAVPDAAGPAGGQAPVTTRLERSEFWFWYRPTKDAAMRVQVADTNQLRAAYTNKQGYATACVPLPAKPGRYALTVAHLDTYGDEVEKTACAYALQPDVLTLAVDWEALQVGGQKQAAEALCQLATGGVQIVYLSSPKAGSPTEAHGWLSRHGYPDGPVLAWRGAASWAGRPDEPSGALPGVRGQIPGMVIGVLHEDDGIEPMKRLNMIPVWIGAGGDKSLVHVQDWPTLAGRILSASGLQGRQDFSAMPPRALRQALEGAE